jgi:hypothetical protein
LLSSGLLDHISSLLLLLLPLKYIYFRILYLIKKKWKAKEIVAHTQKSSIFFRNLHFCKWITNDSIVVVVLFLVI